MVGLSRLRCAIYSSIAPYGSPLFPNHFNHHPFRPSPVELAIKDLFPWSEVEPAVGNGDNDFAAHDLAFHVGVGVVFAGAIVMVTLGRRIEGGQFLEPLL